MSNKDIELRKLTKSDGTQVGIMTPAHAVYSNDGTRLDYTLEKKLEEGDFTAFGATEVDKIFEDAGIELPMTEEEKNEYLKQIAEINTKATATAALIERSNSFGQGCKVLQAKASTDVLKSTDFAEANTIYEIQSDFDVEEVSGVKKLALPANSTIKFNGGSINDATIEFNNTKIEGTPSFINCKCSGKLSNDEVTPEMFGVPEADENGKYDISAAIQRAFDGGNKNIYIAAKDYYWENTVVIPCNSTDNSSRIHLYGDFATRSPYYGTDTWLSILVTADTAIQFKDWDGSHRGFLNMHNLNFTFDWHTFTYKDEDGEEISNYFFRTDTIFIDGRLGESIIDNVGVKYAGTIFNGGLVKVSKVTNCVFINVRKACICGDVWDSSFEGNYVNGCGCGYTTKDLSGNVVTTSPAFYLPIRQDYTDKTKYTIGYPCASAFNNNYIEYFDTIFWVYPAKSWEDVIKSSSNYYDIFKYLVRGMQVTWDSDYIDMTKGISPMAVAGKLLSKNDIILRCNNINGGVKAIDSEVKEGITYGYTAVGTNSQSTRYQLVAPPDNEDGTYSETYSLFYSGVPNSGYVNIESYIDKETVDYVIISGTAADRTDLCIINAYTGNLGYNRVSRIKGGYPSQYIFSKLSQLYLSIDLDDLQDNVCEALPTTELFNGRRAVCNGIRYVYYYNGTEEGEWHLDRETIYREEKDDVSDFILGSPTNPTVYNDNSVLDVLAEDNISYTLDDSDANKRYNRLYAFNKVAIKGPVNLEMPDGYVIKKVVEYDTIEYTSVTARSETNNKVLVPFKDSQTGQWTNLKSYTYSGSKYIRITIGKSDGSTFIGTDVAFKPSTEKTGEVTTENGMETVNVTAYRIWSFEDIVDNLKSEIALNKNNIASIEDTYGSGTTEERPTSVTEGYEYYDSTLKKKILWNGTAWVNMDGTELSE